VSFFEVDLSATLKAPDAKNPFRAISEIRGYAFAFSLLMKRLFTANRYYFCL
jgi:hypothetical protein